MDLALTGEQPSARRAFAELFGAESTPGRARAADTAGFGFAAAPSLHVHGEHEFTQEYDIQLYCRRAKAWVTAFADPQRELLTVADRRFSLAAPTAALAGAR